MSGSDAKEQNRKNETSAILKCPFILQGTDVFNRSIRNNFIVLTLN